MCVFNENPKRIEISVLNMSITDRWFQYSRNNIFFVVGRHPTKIVLKRIAVSSVHSGISNMHLSYSIGLSLALVLFRFCDSTPIVHPNMHEWIQK